MALSTFLQALISIVFIYLILSLLTSELQEYLATIFEARAKRLKQSIRQMLGEQDYPYYRLEFNGNGSDKLNQGDWIWLKDGKITKVVTDPSAASIFIKESDSSIIQETDAIESPKGSGEFYIKGKSVTKLSVYEGDNNTKYWAQSVNKINDQTKLTSDQQFIWIKDGDNTAAVNEAEVQPDSPPSDKGTMKSDNLLHLTKYPVYSEVDNPANKVWIKQEDISEVITGTDSQNQHIYYIKGESVIKLPVASIPKISQEPVDKINESPIYLWDVDKPNESPICLWDNDKLTILDGNNMKKLATFNKKLQSKQFNFLTDKLYEHPNIQALNQSSFGWFSVFPSIGMQLNSKIVGLLLFFVVSIIGLVLSVLFNLPLWGFGISILVFLVASGLLVWLYLENEDKYGKVRKSIGPSYIKDSGLFAKTLISVIKENSETPSDTSTEAISTALDKLKFYTPAIPTLKQVIKSSGDTETLFESFLKEQYENIQKRSSGSYKRNSKGLSFLVGLLIAISCNADTFNMITNLTKEGNTTASQLVAALDKQDPAFFQQSCEPDDTTCQNEKNEKLKSIFNSIDTFPLGWPDGLQQKIEELKVLNDTTTFFKQVESNCTQESDPAKLLATQTELLKTSGTCFEKIEELLAKSPDNANYLTPSFLAAIQNVRGKDGKIDATKIVEVVNQYGTFLQAQKDEIGLKQQEIIALIKSNDSTSTQGIAQQIQNTVNNQGGWIKVPLGWLITAIALSMGAPFWFDQLSRIMNVRNGRKPKDP